MTVTDRVLKRARQVRKLRSEGTPWKVIQRKLKVGQVALIQADQRAVRAGLLPPLLNGRLGNESRVRKLGFSYGGIRTQINYSDLLLLIRLHKRYRTTSIAEMLVRHMRDTVDETTD